MFNPKKIFDDDKRKFNKKLPFNYEWRKHSDNAQTKLKILEDYKDKIGWYTQLYDDEDDKDYYAELYKPYKKLLEVSQIEKNITQIMESSIENKFKPDGNNFIFEKGNYLYKGTKYFYTPADDKKFSDSLPFGYYGDEIIAYGYAKRYSGGLQVYELKKDLRLFNITNDANMCMLIDLINKEFKKGKADDIFFDKITYKEFYKAIKVKYGVGINKYYQAYNISKYTKFSEMWLYEPIYEIEQYRNNFDKSYTGWYFGSGFIDRVCARGIMLLMQDKFDGISAKSGFYTPFLPIQGIEIIIWKQSEVLERKPNHEYDSMQFVKKLKFDPFKINFDINLANKNKNFRMINYYLNHKLDLSKTNIDSKEKGIRVMSLNVHNFKSINMDDKPIDILQTILNICSHLSIDICCLQEYYTDIEIKSDKYSYIKDISHVGLVVIYKKDLPIENISSFKLPNQKYLDERRFGLMFELNSKKFIVTHLEVGKRFFDRSGSLLYPDELYKIIKINYNIRVEQLKRILETNPDYIIGDFNFNNLDDEYKFMTKEHSYTTGLVDYTTPFGKQVDFIFAKQPYKYFTKINFNYSDHLPIIAIL